MIRLGLLLSLIFIALWIFAIFDSITADAEKVRGLQKPLWVIIVLFFGPLGAVAWMLWGRPKAAASGSGRGHGGQGPGRPAGPGQRGRARPRPIAPDDDPDFLRSL